MLTPIIVILTAVVAFICPPSFAWVHGTTQSAILGVVMLAMGMTLTADDFKVLASRPLDILIGTVAQYSLMPLIAVGVATLCHLPREVAVGLMLVGCCPGGVSSNIMSFLCKGDVAFSVGMTTSSTILSPLMTPLLMVFLSGKNVDVDAYAMFISILLVTIMPVAIGFFLNHFFGKRAAYLHFVKVMPYVAVVGLACVVGGVTALCGRKFLDCGAIIFLAVFLHNALGYVFGYLVGVVVRFSRPKNRTISIEVGMQNAGLATVLAMKHFPAVPEMAVVSAVSCVWHSISGALLAGIFNKVEALREGYAKRHSV